MKYSFVKDFPGIGACDAYIGAVVSGKKEEKKGCVVCELLAAVDEKRFSRKRKASFSRQTCSTKESWLLAFWRVWAKKRHPNQ